MTVLLLNKRCLERSRESAEPQPKEKIVELKVVILSRTYFIVEALVCQVCLGGQRTERVVSERQSRAQKGEEAEEEGEKGEEETKETYEAC